MKYNDYDITRVTLNDIDGYSVPMTEENMQNIEKRFAVKTGEAGITAYRHTRARKPLRVTFAAAAAIVTALSVCLAASAAFREAFLGLFTATETENVGQGLEKDSYLIFDESIGENETINLADGVIYKLDAESITFDSYYEYDCSADGIIPIETEQLDRVIEYNGAVYRLILDYGIKSDGRLFAHINRDLNINTVSDNYYRVKVVPNRTDIVLLYLGENLAGGTVLFDLTTFEIKDNIFPNNRASDVTFSPDGNKALSLSYGGADVYLTDINTGETTTLPEKYSRFYDWIDNESFVYYIEDFIGGDYGRYNLVTGEAETLTEGALFLAPFSANRGNTGDYLLVENLDCNYGFLNPRTGEVRIYDITFNNETSPDGQWTAFSPEPDYTRLYICDMKSGKIFNINESLLDGREMWGFCWLANNVLAVASDEAGYENQSPEGITNRGKHLYVFRIDESFLTD